MKYDEKTGKPTPESRSDEINLSIQEINEIHKQTNGMSDKMHDVCKMLADIDVSLGFMVDILSVIYNKLIKSEDDSAKESTDEGEQK